MGGISFCFFIERTLTANRNNPFCVRMVFLLGCSLVLIFFIIHKHVFFTEKLRIFAEIPGLLCSVRNKIGHIFTLGKN